MLIIRSMNLINVHFWTYLSIAANNHSRRLAGVFDGGHEMNRYKRNT